MKNNKTTGKRRGTESDRDRGGGGGGVISASQCWLIEFKCLAYMLITHTDTGLPPHRAKSSPSTLLAYRSLSSSRLSFPPSLYVPFPSLPSFLPSFLPSPSGCLRVGIDEHSGRHAALQVEHGGQSFNKRSTRRRFNKERLTPRGRRAEGSTRWEFMKNEYMRVKEGGRERERYFFQIRAQSLSPSFTEATVQILHYRFHGNTHT